MLDLGTVIFLVLTGAVLGLSVWNRSRNPLAVNAALLLCALCLLTNAMAMIWNVAFPESLAMYPYYATPFPIFDAVGLFYCATLLEQKRSWWLGLLSVTFLAAQAIHYSYWKVNPPHLPYAELVSTVHTYVDRLNVLYAIQLTILAIAGGVGLVSHLGRSLADFLGRARAFADKAAVVRKAAKEL